MTLVEKSFKELSQMIEEVAERFFIAKKVCHLSEQGEILAENDAACRFYLSKVEAAYQTLDAREQNLINNEFFYQNYHNWWTSLYPKTSFYRFKRKAMLKFLEAFYHA